MAITVTVLGLEMLQLNAGHSFSNTNNGCDIEQRNELMCVYRDQFIQKWHSNLAREHSVRGNGGNKLRTYRLFKKTFQFESYLENINQRCYRVALTRFRVGAHALLDNRAKVYLFDANPTSIHSQHTFIICLSCI